MIQQKRSNKQINFHRATVLSVLSLFLVILFNTSSFFNFIYESGWAAYMGLLIMAAAVATFVFSVKAFRKKLSVSIALIVYVLISILAFIQGFFALAASGMG